MQSGFDFDNTVLEGFPASQLPPKPEPLASSVTAGMTGEKGFCDSRNVQKDAGGRHRYETEEEERVALIGLIRSALEFNRYPEILTVTAVLDLIGLDPVSRTHWHAQRVFDVMMAHGSRYVAEIVRSDDGKSSYAVFRLVR